MSPIILEAHDLTKKYRHTVALDHIDLQIEKVIHLESPFQSLFIMMEFQ